jgi:hypothetical protein
MTKNPLILEAIRDHCVLEFGYGGELRVVEPQTYGLSGKGNQLLRGYQTSGGSVRGETQMAKLFEVAKMTDLRKTRKKFEGALPTHNPEDSAMVEIFATLLPPQDEDKRRPGKIRRR